MSKLTIMKKQTSLLPISDPKQFVKEGGEILLPRYRTGDPRNYRLDLGNGVLNLEGRDHVTKPGESFKVIPIAFRCLEHGLFAKEVKKWCEVYFINEAGHLSVFLFHGYSVDNLSRATRDLFYQERSLCEVVWTVKLVSKTNKDKQSYFIADFDFEPMDEADLLVLKNLREGIINTYYHIYRSDTADTKTLFAENWSDGKVPTAQELAAEQQRQQDLLKEFATKEEKAAIQQAAKTTTPKEKKKPQVQAA